MLGRLTADEVEAMLACETVGRIGCHADGRTYVVPIMYAYDRGSVIGVSTDGLKLHMMRKNPTVCFEVDSAHDLSNWRSVIAWGRFEELSGADADQAMASFVARFAPIATGAGFGRTPKDITHQYRAQTDGLRAIVYRIRLTETAGRYEISS